MDSLYLAHPYNRPPGRVINGVLYPYIAHRQYARYPDGRFAPKGIGSTSVGAGSSPAIANITSVESDADKRARLLRSSDPIELYNNRHLLSSSEINERINRINTETRLADLAVSQQRANSPAAKGKKIIDGIVSAANTAGKVYAAWNSDAGKAARKFLGMKVPDKNDKFNALVKQFANDSDADILKVAQRLENLRKIERNLYGTGGDNKK